MDLRLILRLVREKLQDGGTYIVAAVVGTLINGYGQLLVPWFRGITDPVGALVSEFSIRPTLTVVSIFLAFAFPLCVGLYSSVATRYKNRRFESLADFPDRKPDPVFRVLKNGRIIEAGATTRVLLDMHDVDFAQRILGENAWAEILSQEESGGGSKVYFEAEGAHYMVYHAPTADDQINIYLTRLPA